ncbi:MAG: Gfo/Idh/MocA family protein, partial [Dehalococcoidia bacterium]
AASGSNEGVAKKAAAELGARWFPQASDAISREKVEAVYLATTPKEHPEAVKLASENNLDILCDKPIATNLADADTVLKLAEKAGVRLMLPFNPRYQLGTQKLKEMIDAGELGELRIIHIVKCGKVPLAIKSMDLRWFLDTQVAGFGGFGDIGIHALDALRWLTGREALSVYAQIHNGASPDLPIDSIGTAIIEIEGETLATLTSGWINPPGFPSFLDTRFEVVGTQKTGVVEKAYREMKVFDDNGAEFIPVSRPDIDCLVDAFVHSVMEEKEPPITGKDGRAALELTLAAYRSAKTGEVVSLPLKE